MSNKLRKRGAPALVVSLTVAILTSLLTYPAGAENTRVLDLERDSSQYLSIADGSQTGLDLTGNYTFEMWVRLESEPTANYSLISKWDETAGYRSYEFAYWNDSGTKKFRFHTSSDGSNNNSATINYTLTTGVWYHLAATYTASSGQVEVFVNGSSIGTASGLHTSIYNGIAPFHIGYSTGLGTSYFDGQIDDVRVWSTVRSSSDISANYRKELTGSESNLQGYWKLNDDFTDATSNNNDLTSNNSPTFLESLPFSDTLVRKRANESVASSTTLQNDDYLAVQLEANTTYLIDGVLFATSTNATPDLKFGFTTPSGATMRIGYIGTSGGVLMNSGDESDAMALTAVPSPVMLSGTVVIGSTAGTLQLQWAQNRSNAADVTVMDGSYLRAMKTFE